MSRLLVLLLAGSVVASPVPLSHRTINPNRPNTNALVKQYRNQLKLAASSSFNGWEEGKAFDGDPLTSWFSAVGDAPMSGKQPWVSVAFPEAVIVRRVTALGNREVQWPTGYSVLEGRIDLLDANGRVIVGRTVKAAGDKFDLNLIPIGPVVGVRTVRITATADQKQSNEVGVAEVQVE